MTFLGRWARRTIGRIDSVLAGVANHEALVESALRATTERLRALDASAVRLERDREALHGSLEEERGRALAARERARTEPDEATALTWLGRSKQSTRRVVDLDSRLTTLGEGLRHLHAERERLTAHGAELELARRELLCRQECAGALRTVGAPDPSAAEARAALERWERQVAATETTLEIRREVSLLEESLEDEPTLLTELRELRRSSR